MLNLSTIIDYNIESIKFEIKMLDFLKIKKKKNTNQEKNAIDMMTLMLLSQKYLNEMKETANLPAVIDDNIKNIKSEIRRLESLDLHNSKNYTLLSNKLATLEKEIQLKERAKSNIELIKLIHNEFPNSIIIGIQAFEDLLNKYNLIFGELSNYTGTIPESNIQEISSCKERLYSFINEIKDIDLSMNIYKLEEIYTSSERTINSVKKLLEKTNNIIFSEERFENTSVFHECSCYYDENNCTFVNHRIPGSTLIYCHRIKKYSLFIACPKEQLKVQPLKFIKKPVDPIVFNVFKGIIVIQSIWGEESEDQIIKNYIEYNKFIDVL